MERQPPADLPAVGCRHRRNWLEERQSYRDIEAEYFSEPEQVPYRYRLQYLALRKGIVSMEANLAWADEVMAFLEHQARH